LNFGRSEHRVAYPGITHKTVASKLLKQISGHITNRLADEAMLGTRNILLTSTNTLNMGKEPQAPQAKQGLPAEILRN
jgi:hypothetical protein